MTYAIDETLLSKARELGPLIRQHAAEAERERRLSKPVIDALNGAGITKMLLPKSLGGLERKAEQTMQAELGKSFSTIVRPIDELEALLEKDPYAKFELEPKAKRVVTFLKNEP